MLFAIRGEVIPKKGSDRGELPRRRVGCGQNGGPKEGIPGGRTNITHVGEVHPQKKVLPAVWESSRRLEG